MRRSMAGIEAVVMPAFAVATPDFEAVIVGWVG
jgi:hypothetical protein